MRAENPTPIVESLGSLSQIPEPYPVPTTKVRMTTRLCVIETPK